MPDLKLFNELRQGFEKLYGMPHSVAAYAPGRVEVLGNHTDYNEGYVLSAAINMGTFFLVALSENSTCEIHAADIGKSHVFDIHANRPSKTDMWANYVKGVAAGLSKRKKLRRGFKALFMGNLPLGAGLSSSAALEMSSGLALAKLYGMKISPLEMARIGQSSEHDFVGVKCGLLDQVTSLSGRRGQLVMTDFRTLKISNIPLGRDACFLMCNTNVKHALVSSAYNERHAQCRKAAAFFRKKLGRRVATLRDVTWQEWQELAPGMNPVTARRAAHVIGEDTRVLLGRKLLAKRKLTGFGKLMIESHDSSRAHFENSCKELDFLVLAARKLKGVLGARLSGGGFGGSAVLLVTPKYAGAIAESIAAGYARRFGHKCDVRLILPSDGARLIS